MGTQKAICSPGAKQAWEVLPPGLCPPALTSHLCPVLLQALGFSLPHQQGAQQVEGALGSVPKHSLRLNSSFLSCQLSPGLRTRALAGPLCLSLPAEPVQSHLAPCPSSTSQVRGGPQALGTRPPLHTLHTGFPGGNSLLTHAYVCITEGTLQISQRASFLPCFSSPSRTSQLSSGHSHPLMLPDHQAVWVPLYLGLKSFWLRRLVNGPSSALPSPNAFLREAGLLASAASVAGPWGFSSLEPVALASCSSWQTQLCCLGCLLSTYCGSGAESRHLPFHPPSKLPGEGPVPPFHS